MSARAKSEEGRILARNLGKKSCFSDKKTWPRCFGSNSQRPDSSCIQCELATSVSSKTWAWGTGFVADPLFESVPPLCLGNLGTFPKNKIHRNE